MLVTFRDNARCQVRITTQPKTITLLCLIGWTTSWLALTDMNRMEPANHEQTILLKRCCTAIKCSCSPTLLLGYRLVLMLVLPFSANSLPLFKSTSGE